MRPIMLATAATCLSLCLQPASAHAFLLSSSPAVGGTIAQAPPEVVLTFSEGVQPTFSSIAVTDKSGARKDNGQPHLEGTETKLAVFVETIPAGQYKVVWHATDSDGHKTQGKYYFQIVP